MRPSIRISALPLAATLAATAALAEAGTVTASLKGHAILPAATCSGAATRSAPASSRPDLAGRGAFIAETRLADRTLVSPDHPGLKQPNLPAERAWTGRSWKSPLEVNGNKIDDFNVISETRGVVIDLGALGAAVRKLSYVDLMDIEDSNDAAGIGGMDGKFTFPLVTIEDVDTSTASTASSGTTTNCRSRPAGRSARRMPTSGSFCMSAA